MNNTNFTPTKNKTQMTKLYIGNISYRTTEANLKTHFESFGKTKEVKLMVYRGYSRGFGFVEYETEEDAKKALSANGVEFEGRKLHIAVARPPREKVTKEAENAEKTEKGEKRPQRGFRRFRGRRRQFRQRGERKQNEKSEKKEKIEKKEKKERQPREESENVVFVKNISFKCKDEDLKELFKEFNVVEANVVTFKNKKGEVRSKGFGFVDVKTKEDQTKAVEKLNGTMHMERKIVVAKAFKRQEQEKKE